MWSSIFLYILLKITSSIPKQNSNWLEAKPPRGERAGETLAGRLEVPRGPQNLCLIMLLNLRICGRPIVSQKSQTILLDYHFLITLFDRTVCHNLSLITRHS